MAKRVIMAVGAHADDIELNIGGTVLKYLERGYELVYVMSTNNMSGRWNHIRPDGVRDGRLPPYFEIQPQRKKEAAAAARRRFTWITRSVTTLEQMGRRRKYVTAAIGLTV
jgi:LmbE family N-acetylglucosaminyl deacetylase